MIRVRMVRVMWPGARFIRLIGVTDVKNVFVYVIWRLFFCEIVNRKYAELLIPANIYLSVFNIGSVLH